MQGVGWGGGEGKVYLISGRLRYIFYPVLCDILNAGTSL